MSALIQHISCSLSKATLLVNKLVKLGYFERFKTLEDRHVVYVKLTQTSLDVYDVQIKYIRAFFSGTAVLLTNQEQETCYRLFCKLAMFLK